MLPNFILLWRQLLDRNIKVIVFRINVIPWTIPREIRCEIGMTTSHVVMAEFDLERLCQNLDDHFLGTKELLRNCVNCIEGFNSRCAMLAHEAKLTAITRQKWIIDSWSMAVIAQGMSGADIANYHVFDMLSRRGF